MKAIFCLLILYFSLVGCSKNEADNDKMMVSTMAPPPPNSDAKSKLEDVPASAKIPQKIIKEASLRFETNDLENTFSQIQIAIKQNKASVQNDSEGREYNNVFRNITVRVPSENFDAFIESISKGVSYFERKDISSENVTEQYIDLTSRLKTKQKLEDRYLEILQKATKISEILEIEKQISVIREEIEAKEGQLKYLESRVSESTVTIEFYKTIAEKEGVKASYGSKILTAIQTGFFELSGLLLFIIGAWPFILVICVVGYFIRRRFKRKKI